MANTKTVAVRISEEEVELLDDIANEEQCYRTDVLRKAIREYIESYFSGPCLTPP